LLLDICIKSTLQMEGNLEALVVGGDNIESLRQELLAQGIQTVTHWSGRKHV
jgi:hypothetical protein